MILTDTVPERGHTRHTYNVPTGPRRVSVKALGEDVPSGLLASESGRTPREDVRRSILAGIQSKAEQAVDTGVGGLGGRLLRGEERDAGGLL